MNLPQDHRRLCLCASLALLTAFTGYAGVPSQPSSRELQLLVGNPVPVRVSKWWAPFPLQTTGLPVYEIVPDKYDANKLRSWASRFGVKGDIEPIPTDFSDAPGWWI